MEQRLILEKERIYNRLYDIMERLHNFNLEIESAIHSSP